MTFSLYSNSRKLHFQTKHKQYTQNYTKFIDDGTIKRRTRSNDLDQRAEIKASAEYLVF